MARTIRDTALETRAARERLRPRGKPYYRAIEPGLHLGYRKARGRRGQRVAGSWVVRLYAGQQAYTVEKIGSADDFADADGEAVLSFKQAQDAARARLTNHAQAKSAGRAGPLTVRMAIDDYLAFLEANRKSARDARYKAEAFILPALGDTDVAALTTQQIRDWLNGLVKAAPRLRTKPDEKQRHRKGVNIGDPEVMRRRRSTANRILTTLKGALNRQFREGHVSSDVAWRRVEPFEGVDAARIRYLSVAEWTRLINAAAPEFRPLVAAALCSGARYGELGRLEVRDFNPDSETLHVHTSKSGFGRHIELTAEGAAFFSRHCRGRAGHESMFITTAGTAWRASQQARPMRTACTAAKISPRISFHGLRHTYASLAVMNGTPLLVVAKNLGHSDTRMVEKFYGHLAPSYIRDAIRKGAPTFGIDVDRKVMKMQRRTQ